MNPASAGSPAPAGGASRSRYSTNSDATRSKRAQRYRLRERLRKVTPLPRVASCGRGVLPDRGVMVKRRADGECRFGGLLLCGSVWSCPTCSAAIRSQRAEELNYAAVGWEKRGHGLAFLTLTVKHGRGDDFSALMASVLGCWRAVRQHRAVRRALDGIGCAGFVRAIEVTWGGYAGFHPHLHVLLFLEQPVTVEQLRPVANTIYTVWGDAAAEAGFGKPTRERAVRLDPVGVGHGRTLAEYVAKVQDGPEGQLRPGGWGVAHEVTRADAKQGRGRHLTPFQIAQRAADGERVYVGLWFVYCRGVRGRRALEWSRNGLRQRLGLGAELTDQQAADGADECPTTVVAIGRDDWRLVLRFRCASEVLERAEAGGAQSVRELLAELRWRAWWVEPPEAPAPPAAAA